MSASLRGGITLTKLIDVGRTIGYVGSVSLSVLEIDRLLSELEQQYQRDKETLLRMRDFAFRHQGVGAPPPSEVWPISGRLTPTRSGIKTDRHIIREFLAGWSGKFTIPDLIAAAERAGKTERALLDPNIWSSTIYWLCQNGLVAVVTPREGKTHGVYRVSVSPQEMLAPKRRPRVNEFPLEKIVAEAIQKIDLLRFGRKELTEFLHR